MSDIRTLDDAISRIKELERRLEAAEKRASSKAWTFNEKETPFIIAETYQDLQRIKVDPPALGFVRSHVKTESVVHYDDLGLPEEVKDVYKKYPVARYFVRTYPPPPKVDFVHMPVADSPSGTTWETKIYQPSAGISGAVVYFDQNIVLNESTFQVGTSLLHPGGGGNPLYKITDIKTVTKVEGGREIDIIESVIVDYANGMKTTELAWLEIDILPPWGGDNSILPLDADAKTTWDLPTYVPNDLED